jgi:hypothetical protein
MTTRDFLFVMFPLAIILGIVAFVGLQEMSMLEKHDLGGPSVTPTNLTARVE